MSTLNTHSISPRPFEIHQRPIIDFIRQDFSHEFPFLIKHTLTDRTIQLQFISHLPNKLVQLFRGLVQSNVCSVRWMVFVISIRLNSKFMHFSSTFHKFTPYWTFIFLLGTSFYCCFGHCDLPALRLLRVEMLVAVGQSEVSAFSLVTKSYTSFHHVVVLVEMVIHFGDNGDLKIT